MEQKKQVNNSGKGIPEKTAVALKYDPDKDVAPKVIATGKGYLAKKIIENAKEENVPIHQDANVANSLSKLELGDTIPSELYEVVAQILIYVDRVDEMKKNNEESYE